MLAEVNETIENAKNVVNVVALPPEAGDSGSQESDVEDVADTQPTMLCRAHAGPARAARTGPISIWPRALQWSRMGLPHEFHNFQTVYSNSSFFKIIKKVSLFACFNF